MSEYADNLLKKYKRKMQESIDKLERKKTTIIGHKIVWLNADVVEVDGVTYLYNGRDWIQKGDPG